MGRTGARGPAFRLLGLPGRGQGSLGSAPREWPRGNPFRWRSRGTGFCLQLLTISFLSGAHTCPSALAGPLGGSASKIEASRQPKTRCPGNDRAWALARTASSAGVQFIPRVSGSAPFRASVRTVVSPARPLSCSPGPRAAHDPGVQVDGAGGCFSAKSGGDVAVWSVPGLPLPAPVYLSRRFRDSLEAAGAPATL